MMKVFVSQPMRDKDPEEVLKIREETAKCVMDTMYRGREYEIIDQYNTTYDGRSKQETLDKYGTAWNLGDSIMQMSQANLIIFAKNWRSARGCIIEKIICEEYGLPYVCADTYSQDA